MPQQRDITLDICRGLIMIYIVCVIHVIYWFDLGTEPLKSALLFEMPVIFFIAGASQRVSGKEKTFRETIVNRFRRLILPLYIFLAVLFSILAIYTAVHPECFHTLFDPWKTIKVLCTGGSDTIPYYGYTWFISVYFIISCSLPLQRKLLRHVPTWAYLLLIAATVLLLSGGVHFGGETEIKHIPVYNFFYIAGYAYYRKCSKPLLYSTAAVTTLFTIICFANGTMLPMQSHKFPADILFLVFGTSALCILSIAIKKVALYLRIRKTTIRPNGIIDIWNKRGYTIYLYQTISHSITYHLVHRWAESMEYYFAAFIIYSVTVFVITTAMSYVTYPLEGFLSKK